MNRDGCNLRGLADRLLHHAPRAAGWRCADDLRPRSVRGRVEKARLQTRVGWSLDWVGSPTHTNAPRGLRLGCPACARILTIRHDGATSGAAWVDFRDAITGAE